MVFVVLKSGKILRYNDAEQITTSEDGNSYVLLTKDGAYLVADINRDCVERVEWKAPCRVFRANRRTGRY
jgi:hypothetical protein